MRVGCSGWATVAGCGCLSQNQHSGLLGGVFGVQKCGFGSSQDMVGFMGLGLRVPNSSLATPQILGGSIPNPSGDPNSHFGGCFGANLVKIGKMHHRDPTNTSPITFGTPKYPIPSAKIPPTPNPKKPHGAKVAPFAAPGGGLGVRAACWGCLVGSSGVPRHAVGARCGHGVCTPLPCTWLPTHHHLNPWGPTGGNGGCYPLTPDCFDWNFCPALWPHWASPMCTALKGPNTHVLGHMGSHFIRARGGAHVLGLLGLYAQGGQANAFLDFPRSAVGIWGKIATLTSSQ